MIHARYYAISLISVYLSSLFLIPSFPIILVQLKYKMQRERKKIITIVSNNFTDHDFCQIVRVKDIEHELRNRVYNCRQKWKK